MPGKPDKFIHIPEYPGGNKALNEFIRQNVRIPEEAIKHRIKGVVRLDVSVDYQGIVRDVKVTHSLGYGCDEEAIRVARLFRFLESFNRGMKVSRNLKIRIPFDASAIPDVQLNYSYSEENKDRKNESKSSKIETYTYTITLPG